MVSQLSLEVAGAVSVWFETLLYGIYTCLYFTSLYITLKKKMLYTLPSKIFFISTMIMYCVCTAHIALNLFRLLRAFVWLRDEDGGPGGYLIDLGRWDNIAHGILNAIMTWMGDSLVIYRCYLVWNSNIYITIIPAILVVISIVANCVALKMYAKYPLGTIFGPSLVHWMNTIYAVAFVQNFMTTSLIAYRIWCQERDARAAGLRTGNSGSSLMPMVKIIVESAMLYMAELLCLIILYALNNNGQYIMQEASVPSVGIVFTLISVRVSMHSLRIIQTTKSRTSQTILWRSPSPTMPTIGTADILASAIHDDPSDTVKSDRDALTTPESEGTVGKHESCASSSSVKEI